MTSAPARAAQYLRMSTEHQRYSLENQAAAIAAYALEHGLRIVSTFTDAGRSGLTLNGRSGLRDLLATIVGGERSFDVVLVLDVSRWGRFQDPDQAAHYEFLCREAGVSIRYCAETFDDDGSLASSIMKQLKRVMAAEYSRELGVKVSRARRHVATLGYRTGGTACFGFHRLLVDLNDEPRTILLYGQRKALSTDRVRLTLGPPAEVAAVRKVFDLSVRRGLRNRAVAEAMLIAGEPPPRGGWTNETVRRILQNELYCGFQLYGRTTARLKGVKRDLPAEQWVRVRIAPPIISEPLFKRAQHLRRPWQRVSDIELLAELRKALRKHGKLSSDLLDASPELRNKETYRKRFGGLNNAFRLAGFEVPPTARRWTDEAMLQHLRRLHEKHGRITRAIIRHDRAAPAVKSYARRFGSFQAAELAAGLEATQDLRTNGGRRWTDEALLRHLRRVHKIHGKVTVALLTADPDAPSGKTYAARFGSLHQAAVAAGTPHNPNYHAAPRDLE